MSYNIKCLQIVDHQILLQIYQKCVILLVKFVY